MCADPAHGAFVALEPNGSLVLQPAAGQQTLIHGVDFAEVLRAVDSLQRQVQELMPRQACKPVVDTTTFAGISGGGGSWAGGVLAGNGKIYGMPYNAAAVLVLDPATNALDVSTIVTEAGSRKWWGGVLAGNGKIYGIPRDSSRVLIVDPATNTTDTTTIMGTWPWTHIWAACAPATARSTASRTRRRLCSLSTRPPTQ